MKPKTPAAFHAFPALLREIKDRIRHAQTRAIISANAELVRLYWDIGRLIDHRQKREGWGTSVIPRLARELRNDLPEEKGFSERNLDRMIAFYRTYPAPADFSPPPVAKLSRPSKVPPLVAKSQKPQRSTKRTAQPDSVIWLIPWAHHVVLMEKAKDLPARLWYMRATLEQGWSRNALAAMIQSEAHRRQGQAVTNFRRVLPLPQSDLARETLKDPYIFDFLTLEEPFHERELETSLLTQVERFLLELGQGFAFVGRQFHLDVDDNDFYLDLLFYHLKLRCFFVIDLKTGAFRPEYAGKMNFYLTVVDEELRHAGDAPSIGLILCQDRNHIIAEYALRDVNKPIGISAYELTRALPVELRSALPTVEEIEDELREAGGVAKTIVAKAPKAKRPTAARKSSPRKPAKKKHSSQRRKN